MNSITLKDLGPVKQLTLPCPENGGLVVLYGENGAGKSLTLNAIESLVEGRGKLRARDGSLGGSISGFGGTITVGRSTRRKGELCVHGFDSRFSIADLHDPKIDSSDAADAKRMKALVQLCGVEADPKLFEKLFESRAEMEKIVPVDDLKETDPVAMSAKIKKRVELEARSEEAQAEHAALRVEEIRKANDGIDLDAFDDQDQLDAELRRATIASAKLAERLENWRTQETDREAAREAIKSAEAAFDGPTAAECEEDMHVAVEYAVKDAKAVNLLKEQLAAAETKAAKSEAHMKATKAKLESAKAHEATIKGWRESISTPSLVRPSFSDAEDAAAAVESAKSAVEQGVRVRDAKKRLVNADAESLKADAHAKRALALREIAKGCDEVLSELIAPLGTALRVEMGRLVLDTPERGATYFSELSDGERLMIEIQIAVEKIGEDGVLFIDQMFWEGLQPKNRQIVVDKLTGSGLVAYTAEAADGPLRAEVLA